MALVEARGQRGARRPRRRLPPGRLRRDGRRRTVDAVRPARRPLQQRRGADVGSPGRLHRGATGTSRSPPTSTPCSGRAAPPSRACSTAAAGSIINTASVLGLIGSEGYARVRRGQGRPRRAHAPDRDRVRAGGARQRDRARLDRHAPVPQGRRGDAHDPSGFLAGLHANIPLHRLGTADDVAGIALFLASDLSAYVTGRGDPGRRRTGGAAMTDPAATTGRASSPAARSGPRRGDRRTGSPTTAIDVVVADLDAGAAERVAGDVGGTRRRGRRAPRRRGRRAGRDGRSVGAARRARAQRRGRDPRRASSTAPTTTGSACSTST